MNCKSVLALLGNHCEWEARVTVRGPGFRCLSVPRFTRAAQSEESVRGDEEVERGPTLPAH